MRCWPSRRGVRTSSYTSGGVSFCRGTRPGWHPGSPRTPKSRNAPSVGGQPSSVCMRLPGVDHRAPHRSMPMTGNQPLRDLADRSPSKRWLSPAEWTAPGDRRARRAAPGSMSWAPEANQEVRVPITGGPLTVGLICASRRRGACAINGPHLQVSVSCCRPHGLRPLPRWLLGLATSFESGCGGCHVPGVCSDVRPGVAATPEGR